MRLFLVLLCLCASGSRTYAEEPQGFAGRLLQTFGFGGKKSDAADSPPSSSAPSLAPPPSSSDSAASAPMFVLKPSPGEEDSKIMQLLGIAPRSEKSAAADAKAKGVTDCPDIVVDGAELRSPPGADAASVRYQLSIRRTARECALNGDDIQVKVGVEGAAILGPAGQSGSYSGNLQIALRRKSDDRLFSEKTVHVGATIPAGAARADFSLLVDDLSAPFISAKAAEDYEVVMRFAPGAEGAAKPVRRGRRGG